MILEATPRDGVRLLTFDRPEHLNALTIALSEALDDAVARAVADGMRAVVLTGNGRAFSAGNDIHEITSVSAVELAAIELRRRRTTDRWFAAPVPTIAAINGICYGGGAILAICADLRVGGPATRVKVSAASYAGANLTWILPTLIGLGHARDVLMTSRVVDGDEAHRIGLLNRFVADGEVVPAALDLAASIAQHPPAGPSTVKRLVNDAIGSTADAAFGREHALQMQSILAPQERPLFADFLARRRPGG